MGDLDKPLNPDQKGLRALTWHLTGVTTPMRQQYRDQMIDCTPAAFGALAARLRQSPLAVAVFASEEALEKANKARGDKPLPVRKLAQ